MNEVVTDGQVVQWAFDNYKFIAVIFALCLGIAKQRWDHNRLREDYEDTVKMVDKTCEQMSTLMGLVSNLKLELGMSREQQTLSITKIENLVMRILERNK